jgi:hypothetical protein
MTLILLFVAFVLLIRIPLKLRIHLAFSVIPLPFFLVDSPHIVSMLLLHLLHALLIELLSAPLLGISGLILGCRSGLRAVLHLRLFPAAATSTERSRKNG